jgi:hypothetical protein
VLLKIEKLDLNGMIFFILFNDLMNGHAFQKSTATASALQLPF